MTGRASWRNPQMILRAPASTFDDVPIRMRFGEARLRMV
jgi:hypothetical protein